MLHTYNIWHERVKLMLNFIPSVLDTVNMQQTQTALLPVLLIYKLWRKIVTIL